MKVYLFIDRYPYFSETFIYNQFRSLLEQGIDANLVYINSSGVPVDHGVVKYINQSGKIHLLVHGFNFNIFKNLLFFPKQSYRLIKYFSFKKSLFYISNLKILLNIENSDIVHAHFGRVGEIIGKLYACRLFYKVKLVNSFHGVDIRPDRLNRYSYEYKNLFKYASLLLVNSQYSFELVEQIEKSKNNILKILPVGVELDIFFSDKKKVFIHPFSLIFVGRLVNWKGPLLAIKIVEELYISIPDLVLNIIGDGEELINLQEYVSLKGLQRVVKFHGANSQEKIKELYLESSVFIAPGIYDPKTGRCENQGLVIQEAQAMGLPVLVSDIGGMKYGLVDGKSGFVVKNGDIKSFCDRILYFYNNQIKISEFGAFGKDFVSQNFDNRELTKKLIKYYKLI